MDVFLSRMQAQKILGCDKNTMLQIIRSGRVESARKENGGLLVSKQSLEHFIETAWTESSIDVILLQKIIAELKAENADLKRVIKEHGIDYGKQE